MKQEEREDPAEDQEHQDELDQQSSAAPTAQIVGKIKKDYLPCISCKKDIPADSIWCPYCKIQQGR